MLGVADDPFGARKKGTGKMSTGKMSTGKLSTGNKGTKKSCVFVNYFCYHLINI